MPTTLSGIAVCAFDAYGTLFDLDRMTAVAKGALGEQTAALAELWRRKQLEYTWLRSLMGRHADFWHVVGDALDFAMSALGLADPALRAKLMEAYLAPPAFPDAVATLDGLRAAGFKLAILSNGSPSMLTSATKSAGLFNRLDAIISVESAGVYKPHPSVYKLALDKFECQPGQVAFVSANGWDVAGGAAFGFQVLWVNRKRAPREALPAAAHAEIESLAAIPALLRP